MPVEFKLERVARARRLLAHLPGGIHKAQRSAINRAIMAARTSFSKQTRRKYKIRAKELKAAFRVRKATLSSLGASLVGRGRRRPLAEFGPTPTEAGTGGYEPGVGATGTPPMRVQIMRRGGAKIVPGGFVVRKGLVGKRKAKERTPLEFLYGPAIPQMAQAAVDLPKVEKRAQDIMDKRLEHEVTYQLRKAAR